MSRPPVRSPSVPSSSSASWAGALGALLLLFTPSAFFARLIPWLVLFATAVFAWGSFGPHRHSVPKLNRFGAAAAQSAISVYGGYFGGGIGFMMLAALTAAGLAMRNAGATKNVLAGVINASAVAIFVFSPQVRWFAAAIAAAGAYSAASPAACCCGGSTNGHCGCSWW